MALAASAAAAFLLPHSPSGLRGLLAGAGPVAPLIALAAWILLTPAMFPGTVLAAASGLAFGAVRRLATRARRSRSPAVSPRSPLARTAAPPAGRSVSCNASRGSPAARRYWSGAGSPPSSQRA